MSGFVVAHLLKSLFGQPITVGERQVLKCSHTPEFYSGVWLNTSINIQSESVSLVQ